MQNKLVSNQNHAISLLKRNLKSVVCGQDNTIHKVLVTLLAGGHLLIEDKPGLGKTTLARTLAKSIDCSFKRIQFTPDLLPSDITGMNIFDPHSKTLTFQKGPVFSNILLADEINRTTPRIQSALLEAMNEKQVSIDGQTHPLAELFMVIATSNPYGSAGTFELPESQLDRFHRIIHMGYPDKKDELRMLKARNTGDPMQKIEPVITIAAILQLQDDVKKVIINDDLLEYIHSIIDQTRNHPHLQYGASPRAALHVMNNCKANAFLCGRDFVIPDDIKACAKDVLSHRLKLRNITKFKNPKEQCKKIIVDILKTTPVPL